ncbi:oxygenase MpaB family protein [Streptomyces fragilis]|uniref:Oxygenase MpaB family protein n=2 Tax=Streptomyces fragilis TaxID=67301 RepID=A0ABV2YKM3_9ACTN|nr:oxygenase MpaB family protein [Streptomyces fragilis]
MTVTQPAATASRVRAPLPGGPVWRIFGDVRSLLLAPELLLLQVAHPVVGAGVADHSNFRAEPWPRLGRTLLSLSTVIYGGQEAATAEARRLIGVHAGMKGLDASGRRYHALHPEAYHWVHATLVKAPVDAMRLFGPGLGEDELAAYYREMRDVGRVWGLKDYHLPPDWPSFLAYYDAMVADRLEPNRSVRDVLDALASPARPAPWVPDALWRPVARAAGRAALFVTVGVLPPVLRERFGLSWSPRQERRLRRFARVVRLLVAPLPVRLRVALGGVLARRAGRRGRARAASA